MLAQPPRITQRLTTTHTSLLSQDHTMTSLGKLANANAQDLERFGWKELVNARRGASHLAPNLETLPHKARRLLHHLQRRGASVPLTTAPWPIARRDWASARGPHPSTDEYHEFVAEEMTDFCQQGYWLILPYHTVRTWDNLRLSPLGVVPQRERRPRLIVDYTFSGVNADTLRVAPAEAMQFGRTLQRVITQVVHSNPRFGPPKLAKLDIADGFYRVALNVNDIPKLAVALPPAPDGTPLVALPLALPMGWVESPPYFTSLTETACDLVNAAVKGRIVPKPLHRLETLSQTPPAAGAQQLARHDQGVLPYGWGETNSTLIHHARPTSAAPAPLATADDVHVAPAPLATADVYVDDFILVAQTKRWQARLMREALHAIDTILRPLQSHDPPTRKEPVSVKKLRQGDAHWSHQKQILGWIIDTVDGTLTLPPHRLQRFLELLDSVTPNTKRMATKRWHQILGELRSMALGLPGARGLFSALQEALQRRDGRHRIRLTRHVFAAIEDFRHIATSLAQRPTRLRELVPVSPSDVGACDACRLGMGGVWFDLLDASTHPIIWRAAFPPAIQGALTTFDNPRGTLSIGDLELAGTLAHQEVLASTRHTAERTIWLGSDNTAAVAWATKGSVTSNAARAYLLRLSALQQRHYRYHPRYYHVPAEVLDATLPSTHTALLADVRTAVHTSSTHLSARRAAATHAAWQLWETFCTSLGLPPFLDSLTPTARIVVLQLFAQRYRTGGLAPSRRPVRARTVEDALRVVAQTFTRMGAEDPRLTPTGDLDIRITSLLRAWQRADAPPTRTKPLPLPVMTTARDLAMAQRTPQATAVADCLVIAYFFLLRPGEYAGTPLPGGDNLFRLEDVTLWLDNTPLDHWHDTPESLRRTTFATLRFTSQKNGVRGETVGHARSGHPTLCPVQAITSRILYLRSLGALPHTPLNAFRPNITSAWQFIQPNQLTALLRAAVRCLPSNPGFTPHDVSARSLRAGGAMALLNAGTDLARIRLLGRWRSDEVYRYLHLQAPSVMAPLAPAILRGGQFRMRPSDSSTHPSLPPP